MSPYSLEVTRTMCLFCHFLLYVGKVTGLGNEMFLMSSVEMVDVLNSEKFVVVHISTKREAGIPAVVGCRIAAMNLKTGDRIRVDGGKDVVTLLNGGNNGKQQ